MRFCPDLELHLVLIACLSSSSVGGEEQFDQSMATASLSTSWTLSNGSTCAEWFTDGSFLLPVLHMETYGFGFYGMETQISGDYFLPVFILPCYDYGLTSTPAADITYLQYLNDSLVISMTTGSIECKFSVISIVTSRPVQYMKFSSHWHLRVYQWKREAFEWTETVDLMTEIVGDCGYPFVCGRYRICSNRQCRCPASSNQTAYFKQISDRNPGVGCSEILPLSCGAFRNVSFLELPGVAYFDFGWSFQNKKKSDNEAEDEDYLDQVPGMPSKFSYHDLKALTENFSKKHGVGGFGCVFEGTLTDGMRVAVKHLQGLGQINSSFLAEVKSIGSIHHVNSKLFDSSQDEEDRNLLNLLKRKAEKDWFFEMVDKRLVDLQLCEVEAVTIMKLATWCLQADYTRRLSMSTVIRELKGAIGVEDDLDYNFWTHSVS
ncbi:hypothetical protein CRG98_045970 [Punica granatum]|uniref:Protein kinase domain-containing protein n=1 Tax=Punica granatum TaxID=22663 RepID=A0A2I0HPF0_PUNGR|nr:hypothetical protein CRG98_045970 [Punica granatum]